MYPTGEHFATLASVAFLEALQDSTMLQPTSIGTGLLFPTSIYDIRLGGDAAMVGSDRVISLPIPGVIITIGRPYGTEFGYTGADPYKDLYITIPFSVWAQTQNTQDDVQQALEFARDRRTNVFDKYSLNIDTESVVGGKPRPDSPITGLSVVDYRWKFWFSRNA